MAEIKRHWHDLRSLLAEVSACEVEVEIAPGLQKWCPASRLRAVTVNFLGYSVPAGTVLEAEDHGASTYPNEIRYGETVRDFPAEALAATALEVATWVQEHWNSARCT